MPAVKPPQIQFSLHCNATQHGTHVRVVGSCESLGAWCPARALVLHTNPEKFPLWQSEIQELLDTEIGENIEYKYVICNEDGAPQRWEERENRVLDASVFNFKPSNIVIVSEIYNASAGTATSTYVMGPRISYKVSKCDQKGERKKRVPDEFDVEQRDSMCNSEGKQRVSMWNPDGKQEEVLESHNVFDMVNQRYSYCVPSMVAMWEGNANEPISTSPNFRENPRRSRSKSLLSDESKQGLTEEAAPISTSPSFRANPRRSRSISLLSNIWSDDSPKEQVLQSVNTITTPISSLCGLKDVGSQPVLKDAAPEAEAGSSSPKSTATGGTWNPELDTPPMHAPHTSFSLLSNIWSDDSPKEQVQDLSIGPTDLLHVEVGDDGSTVNYTNVSSFPFKASPRRSFPADSRENQERGSREPEIKPRLSQIFWL